MNAHTKKRLYGCNICHNTFTANCSLKRHILTIHKAETDSCLPDM